MDDLTVIIPTAGCGSRIMYSPKSLIKLDNGQNLLSRQIDIINQNFTPDDIYCVVGFKKNQIKKEIKCKNIEFIENNDFENTNVSYSIGLALNEISKKQNILIIYGDLVFDNDIKIPFSSGTSILSDFSKEKFFKKDEVGINSMNSSVVNMNYGVKNKWCHILYVDKVDREKIDKIFIDKNNKKLFGFESINIAVENGVEFKNIRTENVIEIDSYKDLIKANNYIKQ